MGVENKRRIGECETIPRELAASSTHKSLNPDSQKLIVVAETQELFGYGDYKN